MKRFTRNCCYCISHAQPFGMEAIVGPQYEIDGRFAGCFPTVRCSACGKDYCDSGLDFPAVHICDLPDPSQWRRRRIVTPSRFRELAAAACQALGAAYRFVPGCNLGPFEARRAVVGRMFEWFGTVPFIRQDLVEALATRGVILKTAKVVLRRAASSLADYALPQAEVVEVLHSEHFRKHDLSFCPECGNSVGEVRILPTGTRTWLLLDRTKRMQVPAMFTPSRHEGPLLISDAFAEALRSLRPSGVALTELGAWV